MGITEKNFLRQFSTYLYKTSRQDNLYSIPIGTWTTLYPALTTQILLFTNKVQRIFVPKFYHKKGQKIF